MAVALKRKKLSVSEKVKIIREVGKSSTVFQNGDAVSIIME